MGEDAGHDPVPVARGPRDVAVLHVADRGDIRIELLGDVAPGTVANFEKLAGQGFYDGTTFHRVVPGFMIQGGDPNTKDRDPRDDGIGGPGYLIPDEPTPISHRRGIVAMANKGNPDTGGSQFFIMVADKPALDGSYTVFGHVVAGMDVADAIAETPRDVYGRHGPRDRPLEDVVVESVTLEPDAGGTNAPAPPEPPPPPSGDLGGSEWDEGGV
jgi:peptidyl-prolyl cis-trans isomerase B (cyclophilin B)